ncbi:hypothetical protein SCMC78_49550 [Streptomyces sp. CMC78]|uniref:Uncharacterized protein n=1 Tax=Streptomyces sp. CMC78 TaxID=3231512 RepID=A0AB33KND6_9ACTN
MGPRGESVLLMGGVPFVSGFVQVSYGVKCAGSGGVPGAPGIRFALKPGQTKPVRRLRTSAPSPPGD